MKNIKASLIAFSVLALLSPSNAAAAAFTESFSGYANGPLVGQGSPAWVQLGASVSNVVQVNSEAVSLLATGQDVQRNFDSQVSLADGMSIITEFDVTLSSAGATGDFFAHLTTSATAPASPFYNRFYAQSLGGGFHLGLAAGTPAGGVATVPYGGPLTFGVSYHVVSTWNIVTGLDNDTFSMTVAGAPYVSEFIWNATTAEPTELFKFNFRQGTAGEAPLISGIDNLSVTPVPEPSAVVLALLGVGTLLLFGRNRRSAR